MSLITLFTDHVFYEP